jgi:uroporphyrin-III C-methyltransferase
VTLITGHNSDGAVPGEEHSAPDWAALAKGSPVIVLYMALTHLDDIAGRLIAAGRAPDEPVAIISKATTAAQRVLMTTLAGAATAAAGVESPAIVAVGEVVRLHEMLAWYGKR